MAHESTFTGSSRDPAVRVAALSVGEPHPLLHAVLDANATLLMVRDAASVAADAAIYGPQDVDVVLLDGLAGHVGRLRAEAQGAGLGGTPTVVVRADEDEAQDERADEIVLRKQDLPTLPFILMDVASSLSGDAALQERQLHADVRRAVLNCSCVSSAFSATFETLCAQLPIRMGEAWIREDETNTLALAHSWSPDQSMADQMRERLSRVSIDPPIGLPAQSWRRRDPIIAGDLQRWPGFLRCDLVRELGIESAVAAASMNGDHVFAVLLFFTESGALHPSLARLIRTSVGQLGDLLHLKSHETGLRDTQALLERVFSSLSEAVFVVKVPERALMECNDAAERMFGYSRSELLGRSTQQLHVDADAFDRFDQLGKEAVLRGDAFKGRFTMRRRDGSVFPTEHTVTGLFDTGGVCRAAVSVIRDLSRHDALERELEEHRDELARVTRIALVGELAAGVVHDLSNPLTALDHDVAFVEREVSHRSDISTQAHAAIRDIRRRTSQLHDLVREMRDVVRKREPRRSIVNLPEVVGEVLNLFETSAAGRGVTFTLSCEAPVPSVRADHIQLERVIANLVQNAVDAVRPQRGDQRIAIEIRAVAEMVEFRVADSGPGFSQESLAHAFEHFYSSKEEGLGLGLTICRSIIEAHGGSIRIESEANSPSVVVVSLPIDREAGTDAERSVRRR